MGAFKAEGIRVIGWIRLTDRYLKTTTKTETEETLFSLLKGPCHAKSTF